MSVIINITKAKAIAHEKRRIARGNEFAPLDNLIMKAIPGTDFVAVEASRQTIRDKYADLQNVIDNVADLDTLLGVVSQF